MNAKEYKVRYIPCKIYNVFVNLVETCPLYLLYDNKLDDEKLYCLSIGKSPHFKYNKVLNTKTYSKVAKSYHIEHWWLM